MRTRLPLTLLGVLAAVVLAGGPPASSTLVVAAPAAHVSVSTGHGADGLLTTAHPRTVTPLPSAIASARPQLGDHATPRATVGAPPRSHRRFTIPPTAIRGPPA